MKIRLFEFSSIGICRRTALAAALSGSMAGSSVAAANAFGDLCKNHLCCSGGLRPPSFFKQIHHLSALTERRYRIFAEISFEVDGGQICIDGGGQSVTNFVFDHCTFHKPSKPSLMMGAKVAPVLFRQVAMKGRGEKRERSEASRF